MMPASTPQIGHNVRDEITGVEGLYIAYTHWHDRSGEIAIQRTGLDADGKPFDVHWCPQSRVVAA